VILTDEMIERRLREFHAEQEQQERILLNEWEYEAKRDKRKRDRASKESHAKRHQSVEEARED
jgi:hypothetical protein